MRTLRLRPGPGNKTILSRLGVRLPTLPCAQGALRALLAQTVASEHTSPTIGQVVGTLAKISRACCLSCD